jgi:hypothetical protein
MPGSSIFVGLGDTRPLGGPKLRIFAGEVGQHGFHVVFFSAAEDFFLSRVIADFRFDFLETFYATHHDLDGQ